MGAKWKYLKFAGYLMAVATVFTVLLVMCCPPNFMSRHGRRLGARTKTIIETGDMDDRKFVYDLLIKLRNIQKGDEKTKWNPQKVRHDADYDGFWLINLFADYDYVFDDDKLLQGDDGSYTNKFNDELSLCGWLESNLQKKGGIFEYSQVIADSPECCHSSSEFASGPSQRSQATVHRRGKVPVMYVVEEEEHKEEETADDRSKKHKTGEKNDECHMGKVKVTDIELESWIRAMTKGPCDPEYVGPLSELKSRIRKPKKCNPNDKQKYIRAILRRWPNKQKKRILEQMSIQKLYNLFGII